MPSETPRLPLLRSRLPDNWSLRVRECLRSLNWARSPTFADFVEVAVDVSALEFQGALVVGRGAIGVLRCTGAARRRGGRGVFELCGVGGVEVSGDYVCTPSVFCGRRTVEVRHGGGVITIHEVRFGMDSVSVPFDAVFAMNVCEVCNLTMVMEKFGC